MTNEQIGATARIYLTREPDFTSSDRSRISVSGSSTSKWVRGSGRTEFASLTSYCFKQISSKRGVRVNEENTRGNHSAQINKKGK